MKKAFVAGWPVSHSMSPALHGFWLDELSLEGSYEAVPVAPEKFEDFIKELPGSGFVGGNVTIPHKEMAFQLADARDEAAEAIGAVNTLWLENGKVHGGNTDAYGFSENMNQNAPNWRKGGSAIVLGAGGASRAVIYAIIEAGFANIHIVNRTVERAQNLCTRFGSGCEAHAWDALSELLPDTDFLVNTTPMGMGDDDNSWLVDLSGLKDTAIVSDIVYTPLETPLLASAKEASLRTVDGLGMLLHQAVPGFEKWFGSRPTVSMKLRNYILDRMS